MIIHDHCLWKQFYLSTSLSFYLQLLIIDYNHRNYTKKKMKREGLNIRLMTQAKWDYSIPSNGFRISHYKPMKFKTKETIYSQKKLLKSSRKVGTIIETVEQNCTQIIKRQIQYGLNIEKDNVDKVIEDLAQSFELCEKINSNFYAYKSIEGYFQKINEIVRGFHSLTLEYNAYSLAGFCFFQYGNYSITMYYLDKALKILYSKQTIYFFDRKIEILIYKFITKVLLFKGNHKDAREFGYKYLRKTWLYENVDEEMNAFDLLGIIELQSENIQLGKYFHWRMCQGLREKSTMKMMSNQELKKIDGEGIQSSYFQNIMLFVNKHTKFHEILDKYYRSESHQNQPENSKRTKIKHKFMYTHRSYNRNLSNYHLLSRNMVDFQTSKEIHFIKPREIKKVRKLVSDFSSILFNLKRMFKFWKAIEIQQQFDDEWNEGAFL